MGTKGVVGKRVCGYVTFIHEDTYGFSISISIKRSATTSTIDRCSHLAQLCLLSFTPAAARCCFAAAATLTDGIQRLSITMNLPVFFLKCLAMVIAGTYAEKRLLPEALADFLNEPSSIAGLPRAFGLLLLILNVTCFWVMSYGMGVGSQRKKYMEKARKDGEKDVDQRYALPNLYVDGNTRHARAFNCVQRSHQQILETLPQYFVASLVAGLSFPLFTAITCTIWLVARIVWANGYAKSEGDPQKRYSQPIAIFIWFGLMMNFFVAFMTTANILAGESALFW